MNYVCTNCLQVWTNNQLVLKQKEKIKSEKGLDFSDGALIGDKKVKKNRAGEIIKTIFLVNYMS